MTMKKLLFCWLLGAFTWMSFTFFLNNANGRSVFEVVGILMMIVIINLGIFAVLYVGEC